MTVQINEKAKLIIERLTEAGFEAYAVGGAVRDSIMGRTADDFDITTSATPDETKRVFSDLPVIETGIKHGTVTVLVEKLPFEVTTYRSEFGYSDSRHPDSVKFVTSITEDLARRDFTMNAIAYSHKSGIVDSFGGLNDIQSKLIRTVGDPFQRFNEDALRILRALRFSAVLGFEIEKETKKAILSLADSLKKVSGERINAEMKKLVCGVNAQSVINEYIQVLKAILPINGDYSSVSKAPNDYAIRFYCLFGGSYNEALKILRADNNVKKVCKLLFESKPIPNDKTDQKLYISSLGIENAKIVYSYRKALFNEDESDLSEELLKGGFPTSLSDLAVNGTDLLGLGIKGQKIGESLNEILISVIKGDLPNEKDAIISFLKK